MIKFFQKICRQQSRYSIQSMVTHPPGSTSLTMHTVRVCPHKCICATMRTYCTVRTNSAVTDRCSQGRTVTRLGYLPGSLDTTALPPAISLRSGTHSRSASHAFACGEGKSGRNGKASNTGQQSVFFFLVLVLPRCLNFRSFFLPILTPEPSFYFGASTLIQYGLLERTMRPPRARDSMNSTICHRCCVSPVSVF